MLIESTLVSPCPPDRKDKHYLQILEGTKTVPSCMCTSYRCLKGDNYIVVMRKSAMVIFRVDDIELNRK
jgi:hypothetical protein